MTLSPGTRLGPYEIIGPLAVGGMGEVYQGRDTRLMRDVALKVLPERMTHNVDALGRFEREARTVASLSHPHILALYDVGRDEDVRYAVMELLEGETLRGKLALGPTPLSLILEWALQIAGGLSAAHEKGIVHRDLKPENLFVSRDGTIKILDFGLAKADVPETSGGDSPAMFATLPGMIVGTLGYMAPEQVRGGRTDHRSDIFAYGVILYELLAGFRPFSGEAPSDLLASILRDQPRSLAGVPPALARIVERCLEKQPDKRFQSARDVIVALKAVNREPSTSSGGRSTSVSEAPANWRETTTYSPRPGGAPAKSIAVLPFRNLSGGTETDYFGEGITEDILGALARTEGLHVAARTSSFAFRGKDEDVRNIGAQLGVATVLEGSVRVAGQRLRLTAQLVDVATGFNLWSERYDRTLEDVFAVQDEIASAIAQTLRVKLLERAGGTRDVEAYDLFLKGRYYLGRRCLTDAIPPLEQAVERDPAFVSAHTELADAYAMKGFYGGLDTREAYQRARDVTEEARRLEPQSSDVMLTLGILQHYYGWDLEAEERHLKQAQEKDPQASASHAWLALCLASVPRLPEALSAANRAIALEPHAANNWSSLGWVHYHAGAYDEAARQHARAVSLDPQALFPAWSLGVTQMALGAHDDAIRSLTSALVVGGQQSDTLSLLGAAYAEAGRDGEARQILAELHERASREYVAPLFFAQVQSPLGDLDSAFRSLEEGVRHRNAFLHSKVRWYGFFKKVRLDPRFPALDATLVPA
ncbi:MAG: protein kinase [Thermoanaerobaculia bacterium]